MTARCACSVCPASVGAPGDRCARRRDAGCLVPPGEFADRAARPDDPSGLRHRAEAALVGLLNAAGHVR